MSGITQDNRVPLTGKDIELTDTDLPVADQRDHMGRTVRATWSQAFFEDLPWIIALVALVTFCLSAMSGYFR